MSKFCLSWASGLPRRTFKTASHMLKIDEDCPTEIVCFHAQQCVEKYLKALLVMEGIAFPRTHNINELLGLVPVAIRPELETGEQDRLTEYATITRYPGNYESIPMNEARDAVKIARRIRVRARRFLPGKAIKRKKHKPDP